MNKNLHKVLFAAGLLMLLVLSGCRSKNFITVEKQSFVKEGRPYHYIGANYWYGALLGMKDGDRERLKKELDELQAHGVSNLRIMAAAEGGAQDYTVRTTLQPTQGQFNEEFLIGLDYLLVEMQKRNMDAVLYLTNNWEWSGGLAQYLEWNGYGPLPNPNIAPNTWPEFMAYTANFHSCTPCKKALLTQIRHVVKRTNTLSGKKYINDPTIMAWQIANEPRIWNPENEKNFTEWIAEVVSEIKSLDPNHLVSTGSEGMAGSNDDLQAYVRTHQNPQIDYLTMHIWPKNWGWYSAENEEKTIKNAIDNTLRYITQHTEIAQNLAKPIVLEEFGFPREKEQIDPAASIELRNRYYNAVFSALKASVAASKPFAALNFWGYGGIGQNSHPTGKWEVGSDYTADPPQEPQGLNSVFSTDKSTLDLIKNTNKSLGNLP